MKDRTKMDIRLRILEGLYDKDDGSADRLGEEHPDLLDEVEALRTVKAAIDARPKRRPDASSIDAVLEAAASASAGRPAVGRVDRARRDRAPQARRGLYLRSAGVATAVLAVLIAVTTVWQSDMVQENLRIPLGKNAFEAANDDPADAAPADSRYGSSGVDSETAASGDAAAGGSGLDEAGGADGRAPGSGDERAAVSGPGNGFERGNIAGRDVVLGTVEARTAAARPDPANARRDAAIARPDPAGARLDATNAVPDPAGARRESGFELTGANRQAAARSTIAEMERALGRTPSEFTAPAYHRGDLRTGRRPSDVLPAGMRPIMNAAFVEDTSAEDLSWDHAVDVMEMYRQIEMIGDGVGLGWEPPAVPLELMPPTRRQGRDTGIQPAGDRRMP